MLSYCLYPKVVEAFVKQQKEYGYIMRLGSHVFFHGLAVGETNKVNIADGKTLVIKYLGLGDIDKDGMRTVIFELNGIRREVQVPDEAAQKNIVKVPMADPEDKSQVGASIPGAVSKIAVKAGDRVEKNQTLVTIEAMKMETAITARMDGTVDTVEVKEGGTVKGGQLLLCTAGEGWYQEEGKPAVSLHEGSLVMIPAEVKHWHGAKKDSWFSHIAVEIPGEECRSEWCEPVSDEAYSKL